MTYDPAADRAGADGAAIIATLAAAGLDGERVDLRLLRKRARELRPTVPLDHPDREAELVRVSENALVAAAREQLGIDP